MRRGYDRVKGGIGRSYDEIEGVIVSVSGNFNMLSDMLNDGLARNHSKTRPLLHESIVLLVNILFYH